MLQSTPKIGDENFEELFTQEELDIDFATCVNMFEGMDYKTAEKEAIKDHKEWRKHVTTTT